MKLIMLCALAVVAAPAIAQDAPAAEGKSDKKICRMVAQTGSILLRKKYCLTREEWAKLSAATSDRANRAMDQRGMGGNGSFNKE
ncbi:MULTISPECIES: hypothetical protein [unclassified Sphingomonas]|uniref:hypothetical protein n=1 Tax=unclassified Sphingomonas TaxID=196159 RepID=UPI0022B36909|nr:hypothetical protein [Sphingomonas sp. NIBR02145]WHU02225.1 hypothetical protein O3305_18875 [Sphingomonas sp. NIBR02145]